jgi:RNA polymerase sigma-70 factor (ECF subfamily)
MTLTSKEATRTASTDAPPRLTAARRWFARPLHHRAVHEFRVAGVGADSARLRSLLAPDVAVVVDGGGSVEPMIKVIRGVDEALMVLVHGLATQPDVVVEESAVNAQAGLMLRRRGEAIAAMTIDFSAHLISVVWIRLYPERLRRWNHV